MYWCLSCDCAVLEDIEEKGNQVAIMGLIFETARCVHVWIDDPIGNTKWTLRYIRRCTQQKLALENLTPDEHTPLLAPTWLRRSALHGLNAPRDYEDQSRLGDLLDWLRWFARYYVPHWLITLPLPSWLSYYLNSIQTRFAVQLGASARSASTQAGLQDLAGRPWFSRA